MGWGVDQGGVVGGIMHDLLGRTQSRACMGRRNGRMREGVGG